MRLLRRRKRKPFRVFFATDIHGSDRCFRKFLAAASVYDAQAIILGGDVAGKALVPITPLARDRYQVNLHGERREIHRDALSALRAEINDRGLYTMVLEPEEELQLGEDSTALHQLFERTIVEQTRGWCDLAAERLADDVRCIITPGNDDPGSIDRVLRSAQRVECPELDVIQLGPFRLCSMGNTNVTPWRTEREFSEEELADQIRAMVERHGDGKPLVFNFHCPPFDSGLDTAVKLNEDLSPVIDRGSPVSVPVGSIAVRDAVERYQPVVGLHGHIHEAQGMRRLGHAVCLNPGSEYASGYLKGVIVDFTDDGQYANHLFTAG